MSEDVAAKIVIFDTETNIIVEFHCIDIVSAITLDKLLKEGDIYSDKKYVHTIETTGEPND